MPAAGTRCAPSVLSSHAGTGRIGWDGGEPDPSQGACLPWALPRIECQVEIPHPLECPWQAALPCSMSHSEPVNVKKALQAISNGAAAAPCHPPVIYCGVANGAQIFLNLN